jgi:hypothetical protein
VLFRSQCAGKPPGCRFDNSCAPPRRISKSAALVNELGVDIPLCSRGGKEEIEGMKAPHILGSCLPLLRNGHQYGAVESLVWSL